MWLLSDHWFYLVGLERATQSRGSDEEARVYQALKEELPENETAKHCDH